MEEYIRNKKIINWIFKPLVVITVCSMLIMPLFGEWYMANMRTVTNINSVLILLTLVATFFFSRYKKADKYVESISNEINDSGSFQMNRSEEQADDLIVTVYNDFQEDLFAVHSNVSIEGLTFDFKAAKGKNIVYAVKIKRLTMERYCEYMDAVNQTTSFSNVRARQTVVCCFVCNEVAQDVIAVSKMTTTISKTVVYPMIVNAAEKTAYFLSINGGRTAFAVKNILGYSDGIIPESAKSKEKFPFQKELERKMLYFNLKDFKNGRFNPRA